MKHLNLLKSTLLLFALVAGSTSLWAVDDPDWSYAVVEGDGSKLDTEKKTFTVDASHVWSYEGTTVASGSPVVTVGKSTNYAMKFGNSGSVYFSPVILSTSAFSDKAVTKVRLYLKHNGKKSGSLTVKQGSITVGTATTSNTSDWISVTCSESKKGTGGTLQITYEVAQALYVNKIEVWYEDLGTETTTTIDASGITNTDIFVSTAAGSLSASVTEKVGGAAVGGATVSWSSSNEDVATITSTGVVTLKKKGSTTITATYDGNATYAGSSAEYVLNVTSSAPQPTYISITTNYEWLGVSSGSNIAAGDLPKAIDCDGLTVTFGTGGSTKPRGDASNIRVYGGNSMTFTAPVGHFIKEIEFTAGSNWQKSFDADAGSYNSSTKIWSCESEQVEEVTLTVESGSGNNYIEQIDITLVPYVTLSPAKEYTTLTHAKDLDFTGVEGLKAYIATEVAGGNVNMTQVNKVPAGTGLVLKATTPGSAVVVPVFDGTGADVVTSNKMVGSATETTAIAANAGYILSDGVFQPASAGTLPAGKAYLNIAVASAHPLSLDFGDGDVTGIDSVQGSELKVNGYFDLQGRRVAQPTKGLYIVNGKKVIVK